MKQKVQCWNQPAEEIIHTVVVGPCNLPENIVVGYKWNPHRGNVRVGNREIKWFNMFK
jgi:hypothetical protein